MTFDPTTNRVPYGLLNPYERASLESWTHGWEFYRGWADEWVTAPLPAWAVQAVYRGKPAPVVKSKCFNVYPTSVHGSYSTREIADHNASQNRIAVLRIDTCEGVLTTHLEEVEK